jgi:hypothetical protein
MTPEEIAQMHQLIQFYQPAELEDHVLVEKMGAVIVAMGKEIEEIIVSLKSIGDERDLAQADLRTVEAKLFAIKSKANGKAWKTSKQVKAGVLAGLKAVSVQIDGDEIVDAPAFNPATPAPAPLLVP